MIYQIIRYYHLHIEINVPILVKHVIAIFYNYFFMTIVCMQNDRDEICMHGWTLKSLFVHHEFVNILSTERSEILPNSVT